MTTSIHNLIKFLAEIAVQQYLDEQRQQRTLILQATEGQLAEPRPCGQGNAKPCPDFITPSETGPDDNLNERRQKCPEK